MTIKSIVKLGTASLLEKSVFVKVFDSPELNQLVQDLRDTQHHLEGVGIAAPQIGVNQRVILFGFEHSSRYPDEMAVKDTVLINPEFEPLSDEKELGWEGCLSLPGLRGVVSRYCHIRYWGYDLKGERIEREASDFHARVVQHEVDHLDGVLYMHRVEDKRLFGFEDALNFGTGQ